MTSITLKGVYNRLKELSEHSYCDYCTYYSYRAFVRRVREDPTKIIGKPKDGGGAIIWFDLVARKQGKRWVVDQTQFEAIYDALKLHGRQTIPSIRVKYFMPIR